MPVAFDPYETWLDIPRAEQPPHHYRLLGISLYEANPTAISLAADHQRAVLESVAEPDTATLTAQLCKSVELARRCLLDPQRKENYDAKLRTKLGGLPASIAAAPSRHGAPLAAATEPEPESAPEDSNAPAPVNEPERTNEAAHGAGHWHEVGEDHLVEEESVASEAPAAAPWEADPAWLEPSSPKPAPRPAPAPAPAKIARPAPRRAPPAASAEAEADSGDALSFLGSPGNRSAENGAKATPRTAPTGARSKSAAAPLKGKPSTSQPLAKKPGTSAKGKTSTSRLAAIFIPTILTGIALVIGVLMMLNGGDDKKPKSKPGDKKNNPAAAAKGDGIKSLPVKDFGH